MKIMTSYADGLDVNLVLCETWPRVFVGAGTGQ